MVRTFLLTLIAGLAWPAMCFALSFPPPMSDEELLRKSDLVPLVRVLSVTCTATVQDPESKKSVPTGWRARLKLMEVRKGRAENGDIVTVSWSDIPKDWSGGGSFYYYPGEEVWTHLVRARGGGGHENTWWNAKQAALTPPETTQLPTIPGETIEMSGTNPQTPN